MATTQEHGAFALLPLPEPDTLSEAQLSGRACVWGGGPLSNESAVNLGERPSDAHGTAAIWFPRSCPDCMGPHVQQAAEHHAALCELCVDNIAACDIARDLRLLVLEHTR
ncbi:hypothetical protein OOK29_26180 [Streptomyces phaeochromogenes]|uniref:hypothetical protein n=1 Tax=Streptomyces phaeochromogenes TaxID=1923 RepID=UPI0022526C1A|nr:hypothetical protein [Streptomyces phaeochromogenes]MCX5601644.1 hypothetical protein [Streptomyces phaeochromogenes]